MEGGLSKREGEEMRETDVDGEGKELLNVGLD